MQEAAEDMANVLIGPNIREQFLEGINGIVIKCHGAADFLSKLKTRLSH